MSIVDEIQDVELNIDKLKTKLAIEEAVLKRLKAIQGSSGQSTRKRRDGSMNRAIEQSLRESNTPLTINEITERVKALGVTTTSKRGLGPMVSSALRKNKTLFAKVDRGCYDLKTRQIDENIQEQENKELL